MILQFFHELGGTLLFLNQIYRKTKISKSQWMRTLHQGVLILERSWLLVGLAGLFVGGILVIQFTLLVKPYGAIGLLGGLTFSSLIRNIGPLMISFQLCGKVGAYIAAELASMRVTDQIFGLECIGKDPIEYLVVPRFWGIILAGFFLLILGVLCSIFGALLVTLLSTSLNYREFLRTISLFAEASSFVGGLSKSILYAFLVASVACYNGFFASGGARGVGRAVTKSVIYTNFFIVIGNTFFSKLMDLWFLCLPFRAGVPGEPL
jgi:phospholipid/cholesterol/gamma-HCH transport system permease protein